MNLITLEAFYVIVGIVLLLVAGRIAADAAHPKRWGSALFWALLAVTFVLGRAIPSLVTGYLVIAMVVLAAAKQVGRSSSTPGSSPAERTAHEERLRHRLLWPALLIPATAVTGTLLLARVHFGSVRFVEPSQAALISLSLGALFALGLGLWLTKAPVGTPLAEGSRLLQTIGWALILPQLLAALGGIFAQAGVGEVIAGLLGAALPMHAASVAVLAYCGTMALFTMIMGNAFAAFAVATGGDRPAVHRSAARWQSGHHGSHRNVERLLRHAADSDGGQFQHRAGAPARVEGPARGHQGAGAGGRGDLHRESAADVFLCIPVLK